MKKKQKITLYRIIITAVMLVVLQFLPITGIPRLIAYLAAYLVIGYDILRKAGKGILNGRAFDENFLMALATLGAFFLAIWTKSGDYLEGIAVMLFYQIGELFQSYAVGKSRKNISALMDIRPDYANIEKDGKLEQVDPDEVAVGSIIVVQPGEKVPLDGVVESGNASLNTSALTGESRVLISEGCTHHRQCEDIGTAKLPAWINGYTRKQNLQFHFTSGGEFPEDFDGIALAVHCGGCMLNEREMQSRVERAAVAGVPMTNYGVAIAQMHGILRRSLSPFPELLELLK